MAEQQPPSSPQSEDQGGRNAEYIAAITEQIGTPLRDLASQVSSLKDQIKTDSQAENGERNDTPKDLFWIKFSAISNVILTVLMLCVLSAALIVADKQRQAGTLQAEAGIASVRAWLISSTWDYLGAKGPTHSFRVAFKNLGHTPAVDIRTTWHFIFVDNRTFKPSYSDCPITNEVRPGLLGANDSWTTTIPINIDDVMSKMLADKVAALYIFACTKYRDVVSSETRMTQAAGVYPADVGLPGIGIYDRYSKIQ